MAVLRDRFSGHTKWLAIGVLFAMVLTACGGAGTETTETTGSDSLSDTQTTLDQSSDTTSTTVGVDQDPIPVRMGPSSNAFFLPFFVLMEHPEIAEGVGLDPDIRLYSTGVASMEALLANENDVAVAAILPLLGSLEQGADTVLPAWVIWADTQKLVVTNDITGPADLVGKNIAVPPGGAADYSFRLYLAENGISVDDVEITPADPSDLPTLLATGRVDGIQWTEPQAGTAIELAGPDKVHYIDPPIGTVFVDGGPMQVRGGFVDEYGEEGVRRILLAYIAAVEWINDNPVEAAAVMEMVLQLDPGTGQDQIDFVVQSQDGWPVFIDDAAIENIVGIGEWMVENEMLESIPEIESHIRPEFLEAVEPSRVNLSN